MVIGSSSGIAQAIETWSDGFNGGYVDPNSWTLGDIGGRFSLSSSMATLLPHDGSYMAEISGGYGTVGVACRKTFSPPLVDYTVIGYMAYDPTYPLSTGYNMVYLTDTVNSDSIHVFIDPSEFGRIKIWCGGLDDVVEVMGWERYAEPFEWVKVAIHTDSLIQMVGGVPTQVRGARVWINDEYVPFSSTYTWWHGGAFNPCNDMASFTIGSGWGTGHGAYDDFSLMYRAPSVIPGTCEEAIIRNLNYDTDLNTDCYTDLLDWSIFTQQWLNCVEPSDGDCAKPWL